MKEIKETVNRYTALIERAEKYIWENPEVGYKEFKTNEFMIAEFQKLGYTVERFAGITGFTAYYDTERSGATLLLLAELDSLYCSRHPAADRESGACHVCGHNLQCAALLGVAAAVREREINKDLCGKIKFVVVPAEEGIEVSYRMKLMEDGVIRYTSGKPECIARGLLSDVDVAFMLHVGDLSESGALYYIDGGANGVIRKKTVIKGRAAHAGMAPEAGINALFAAELALAATNALRETFAEKDHIRFHSIITKGGDAVNAVPEEVVIESYVRAGNANALAATNEKINRAISGACLAMGAGVTIADVAGSEPLYNDRNLAVLMMHLGEELAGEGKALLHNSWDPSSTDMGDVSSLVPAVHAHFDGHRGALHGEDYRVQDPVKACLDSAYLQVATIMELMKNGCEKAYFVKNNFTPVYSSLEEYLAAKDKLNKQHSTLLYEDGRIIVDLQ